MPRTYDLVALGDTTSDIFLQISDASVVCHLRKKECLLCIEYADKIPVEAMTEILGVGNAANNAVGAARLGLRTALWTILGRDPVGERTVREVFAREGVHTPYIEFDPRHGTNHSTVINFRSERTILVYHQPRTYQFPRLSPAPWMFLTSMGEGWETIVPSLKTTRRRSGARIGFNPGTHQLRSKRSLLSRVFEMTDVLLVNRDESHRILRVDDGSPRELLRGLRKLGPRIVVITDGPRGAYATAEGEHWFMPTIPAPVVERTGAGDSFSTGVLAALFYRKPLSEALAWGAANASSVVQYVGAREGLLRKPAMLRLLRRHHRIIARPL